MADNISDAPVISDGLGRVVLDYPPLNILTRAALAELRASLARLAEEPELRAVLLTATGKHFSAGADVGEHLPPGYVELIPEFLDTVADIAGFPVPVVAAVRGRCLGGGFELVLGADMIVAGDSAVFGQPEIMLGVLPPATCVLLPKLASPSLAAEVVFTGDVLDADRALSTGIVNRVVPDADVETEAEDLARRMTRHSAAALRVGKRMLRGDPGDLRAELREAGRLYDEELMATADAVEGLTAFLEKRKPEWTHR
jgi:cyclohexa-1,5-dienecarbonyl-CoA hydratase